jgi:tRNA G37 N-methylase Trm5
LLNKIPDNRVKVIQGDVKRKITKDLGNFDFIMMARPNLKSSFLSYALLVSKKNTKIFYHLFCKEDKLKFELDKLKKEANKCKKEIKIIKATKIGDIAPYKYRYRVEIKVL